MNYENFKRNILLKLQDYYGTEADVTIKSMLKNNGVEYDAVSISFKGMQKCPAPVISIGWLYREYEDNKIDIQGCADAIITKNEMLKSTNNVEAFSGELMNWQLIKEKVFPMLLSTENNKKLLDGIVSSPLLDLSIAYVIKNEVSNEQWYSVKVTKRMLKYYGISELELHTQAMENLSKDGYKFENMHKVIKNMLSIDTSAEEQEDSLEMYVLTNSSNTYGAAGILDKNMLKRFAGEKNFLIIPSSVHETIFIPAFDSTDISLINEMIKEVNITQVDREDVLSEHCYFYDAEANEIRMCA